MQCLLKGSALRFQASMFWQLNFMKSLWRYLCSTSLACRQCGSLLARLSFFVFLTRRMNDLSTNLHSLHFFSTEWRDSTKVDIIFSGLDWPPPCLTMTSFSPFPPATLDCQGYGGQGLASACWSVNECMAQFGG